MRGCATYFEGVYKELSKFTSPANERVDSDILIYQVPGGMLSNFRTQLKEQGMSDRFDEVVREIPVVREALGWIPLVTPTSQIVGTQAMMNVKFGRWKMICQPAQDIALGKYGKTPGPIDPNVLAQVEKLSGKKPSPTVPPTCWNPAWKNTAGNAPKRACPWRTKSSCSSPCSRNKSKPCSSQKRRRRAAATPAGAGSGFHPPQRPNGDGETSVRHPEWPAARGAGRDLGQLKATRL